MQEIHIIEGTIADNIRYVNKNITDEEIQNIFKKLNLHDKIMKLKDGYNTNISNNEDILSSGEKQMINFARVMAINCDVVILDEVTSNLSYETEILVNNAIKQVTENKIVIIIAHRLSTIKNADLILVMNHGDIVEQGTHEELLAKGGFYADLYNSQFEEVEE